MSNNYEVGLKNFEEEWLKPGEAQFIKTAGGFLNMDYKGKIYKRVSAVRAFPLEKPNLFISIREASEQAEEIAIIEDLEIFSPEEQCLINEQLNMRYFTPKIIKINNIKEEYGYSYWDVNTDTGLVKFVVRMGASNINRIGNDRYIINDIDGNRFEIANANNLAINEQKQLDMYV